MASDDRDFLWGCDNMTQISERVMTFKRGLHIFLEREFMPMVRGVNTHGRRMIGVFLKFIPHLIFACWVVLPYCFLIAGLGYTKPRAEVGNINPHWFIYLIYLGVIGLVLQAITVAVLFIRHVYHLGSKGAAR